MRGRKPKPTALKLLDGNPGKRAINGKEPKAPPGLPGCPEQLSEPAKAEWNRIARALHEIGLLSTLDRTAFAAYCAAYGRWVEAEEKLQETPPLVKTPSGYVQPSPWINIANRQLEIMLKFMAEMGLTPSARSRITVPAQIGPKPWDPEAIGDAREKNSALRYLR